VLQKKLTNGEEVPQANGHEYVGEFQVNDAEGNSDTLHFFGRWVRSEEGTTIFRRLLATRFAPGMSVPFLPRKG